MEGSIKSERGRRPPVAIAVRTLAWVALSLPLLALVVAVGGRSAAGQSAVTLGSSLDQPLASDSLLSSGGFRLDGPSEHPAYGDASGDPHAGATSLGLQIYDSSFGLGPRPADNEAPPAPPLGSSLTRP